MENLNIIDLSGVNFWIVNLNPHGGEDIKLFQQKCIDNKCFAMCWCKMEEIDKYLYRVEESKEEFINKIYTNQKFATAKKTKEEKYDRIKIGDYVIWRDKKSICRIGRVDSELLYDKDGKETYCGSFYYKVGEWKEYANIKEIPTEVWARFTHRHQSTIERIADAKVKILCMKMYHLYDDIKYYINAENYVRSLNYYDLEDVVSIYIHKKLSEDNPNSDYVLLPSTGKSSRQNYEFDFIDIKGNGKTISCQVKNQELIDIANYMNASYDKVYLFSGLGYYNEKVKSKKIEIIDRGELYNYVKNYIGKIKNTTIYQISDDNDNMKNIGNKYLDSCRKKVKVGKWDIYYHEDFRCIVISNDDGKKAFESISVVDEFKVYKA